MGGVKSVFNFVGYSSFFGLVSGTILGIVYYLIIFQFSISVYVIYLALLGALVGVLLGGINGLLLSFITYFFSRDSTPVLYRLIMLLGAVTLSAIVGFLLFSGLFSLYAVTQDSKSQILPIYLATGLAAIASGLLSQSIIRWHRKLIASQSVISNQ